MTTSSPLRRVLRPLAIVVVGGVVGGVVGVGVVGCGGNANAANSAAYQTVKVERGTLQVSIEATGTLQPATQVQIGSRISGQMLKVLVDYNDEVKAGQLLAEIDPAPFKARQNEAAASVNASKAELVRAEAQLVVQEQTTARARELNSRGLNSVADAQSADGAAAVARAAVLLAKANLERSQASLASATADVNATRITSPIDGIVLARTVEAGQTIAASMTAPELFVVAKALDALEVVAKVDESDLAIVKKGAAGEVAVDAFPGQKFAATVSQIRIAPETTDGVVTFPVVLAVSNVDGLLLPGMTATVTIQGPPIDDALIVPATALRFSPSSAGKKATGGQVWTIDAAALANAKPDTPAPQPQAVVVDVKARAGARVQIEGKDIKEGDDVIVAETGARGSGRKPPRVF
ncbi:MAG TPA: efflux RND transporter periplasmic adaptor subunit [Myxococcota bacterium]